MNARSCQLCGKPISRLRVGGDGDFCSREHRNQHRLRRGMDRLEEANKVTSLMRRREKAGHISAARLMCNSALEQRGFLEPKPLAPETEIAAYSPMLPGPAAPRVNRGPDRYKPPRATRLPGAVVSPRADPSRLSIGGRGTLPAVPPRRQKLQAKISQAPLISLRCDPPAPAPVRRDYGMLRRGRIRVHLGNGSLAPGALQPRRALALEYQTHPRSIKSYALEGNALRVSIGMGFHIPGVSWRSFLSRPPAPAGLVWPRAPHRVPQGSQDFTASNRNLEIEIPKFRPHLPAVADRTRPAQFVFPGSLAPRSPFPVTGAVPYKRSTDVTWRLSEPRSRGMVVVPPSAGFAKRNGARAFTIVLLPSSTRPVRQVAFSAFVPREPGSEERRVGKECRSR